MSNQSSFQFKGNGLKALLGLVVMIAVFYFLARGIFWILTVVAPVLLILAAIFDVKVIVNFVKWVGRLYKKDILMGLGVTLLSVIGYPVLFAILFGRAVFSKKVKDARKAYENQQQGEFVEYEEVEEPKPLVLKPRPTKEKQQPPRDSDYDQMFD